VTPLAPLLEAFFTERLQQHRRASPHTVAAYRDTFRLLLRFAAKRVGRQPSDLLLADIDVPFIGSFLSHLEQDRKSSARSRNARLSAIRSFFHFIAAREPAHSALIQRVLAMPQQRFDRNLVAFLTRPEIDALLAAPDKTTRLGRRDHALLVFAVQTGFRVSEITALRVEDLAFGVGAHARCLGKGRKERCTPLTASTATVVRAWISEAHVAGPDLLFPSQRGTRLSHDAVERLVVKYAALAVTNCPTLARKHVTPHTLRHSTAVALLQSGVDRAVIALWLGHESVETTQMYLDADLATKQRALARIAPIQAKAVRFRPKDRLLAFLEGL
jgi:site-specific recombinase XerD